jgi:hypothetical protein
MPTSVDTAVRRWYAIGIRGSPPLERQDFVTPGFLDDPSTIRV